MAEGSEAAKRDNSRVMSALITGAFGLLGTIATVFAVRQDAPSPAPAAAAVSLTPSPAMQPSLLPAPTAMEARSTPKTAPNLLLNFSAFQSRLATHEVDLNERQLIVRPLVGRQVIWKGYVDALTPMSTPTPDAAITVSLVESQEKLGQSMFKTPAFFRFGPAAIDTVSQLAPGDEVTLSGTLTDHSLVGTNITGAHLIAVNGRPAARVIASPESDPPR